MPTEREHQAELRRLARVKGQGPEPIPRLGPELLSFFKQSVQKRQTKLAQIGSVWGRLVPETLCDHCALESFHAGTLKVIVDSSSHLYELKQLLLAGLQDQILLACRATGLRRITLKAGRWYQGDGADRRVKF